MFFEMLSKTLVMCFVLGQSFPQELILQQLNHKDDRIDDSLPGLLPFGTAQRRQGFRPGRTHTELQTAFFKFLLSVVGETSSNDKLRKAAIQIGKFQDVIPDSVPFPCPTVGGRSKTKPTSVDRLRPGDIDVIAAIGDSLTAGNGIAGTSFVQVMIVNAGLSHLIGGQGTWRQYLTLPNILKEYNPNLVGYAYGDTLYSAKPERAEFDIAVPAAMSLDLMSMSQAYVHKLKRDPRVNFTEDWKMLSIFIGGVDICTDICYWKDPFMSAVQHKKDLGETLNYLQENSPRTFVNLVILPNLPGVRSRFKGYGPICRTVYAGFCTCFGASNFKSKYKLMLDVNRKWRRIQVEVALDKRYRSKKDFIVIPQTYFAPRDLTLPEIIVNNKTRTDFRYLSADCFHMSQRGNSVAANGLWNNLLEPFGNKTQLWLKAFNEFKCPTESNPYLNVDVLTNEYKNL